MRYKMLCIVFFISLLFMSPFPSVSNAYEMNRTDREALVRLIKGDIDYIRLPKCHVYTAEQLFVSVAQSIPGVIGVMTMPTTETFEDYGIKHDENGRMITYPKPDRVVNGYIGYVAKKRLGIFKVQHSYLMLPAQEGGTEIYLSKE